LNEVDLLRALGAQARDEADPTIDVARQVHRRLGQRPVARLDRKWAVASLCACSIAAVAVGMIVRSSADGDGVAALAQLVTNDSERDVLLKLVEP
jgi:hypothetical protein